MRTVPDIGIRRRKMTWTPELIIAGLILLVMIPCQFMNVYKADKAYKEELRWFLKHSKKRSRRS